MSWKTEWSRLPFSGWVWHFLSAGGTGQKGHGGESVFSPRWYCLWLQYAALRSSNFNWNNPFASPGFLRTFLPFYPLQPIPSSLSASLPNYVSHTLILNICRAQIYTLFQEYWQSVATINNFSEGISVELFLPSCLPCVWWKFWLSFDRSEGKNRWCGGGAGETVAKKQRGNVSETC